MRNILAHTEMNSSDGRYTVVLACDFSKYLVSRVLDVYRFFQNPPLIVLARRGERIPMDPTKSIRLEAIPLPIIGSERNDMLSRFCASCSTIAYLAYAFIFCLKIRSAHVTVQLVHAHYIFPQGLFGLVVARLLRVPLITSAVGADVNRDMKYHIFFREICGFVLRRSFVTIAVSATLQNALQRFGITHSIYVPNSVDTDLIRPKSEPLSLKSILFVGSMTERKRPLLLLRAFETVLATLPGVTMTMIGSGPLRAVVQEEISQSGLDDRVKLLSEVTTQCLEDLLSKATVFVLPSVSEGLSLALLEAMAAGKAIVASANESHRAVLRDGEHALLFQVDDETELANQILRVLSSEQLRSRLSRSARQLCVREFSHMVTAPILENLYVTNLGERFSTSLS